MAFSSKAVKKDMFVISAVPYGKTLNRGAICGLMPSQFTLKLFIDRRV
jgi:hypothetical protein